MASLSTSVALCTYNGERFLERQLESISQQSAPPDELIVCDDGSSDSTLRILEQFARRVRFSVEVHLNPQNLGPAQNFAKAISLCNGEIIVLSDQDDVWSPFRIERILQVFSQHPDAFYTFSDAELIDEDGASSGMTLWQAARHENRLSNFVGSRQLAILLRQNLIPGATMAFRRRYLEIVLPIPPSWMHDYWIALIGSALSTGVPIAEPLVYYRRHAAQVCGWKRLSWFQVLWTSLQTDPVADQEKVKTFELLGTRLHTAIEYCECPEDRLVLIRDKQAHLSTRTRIRITRGLRKVIALMRELLTGRYRRYSKSWQSVFRDLCCTRAAK